MKFLFCNFGIWFLLFGLLIKNLPHLNITLVMLRRREGERRGIFIREFHDRIGAQGVHGLKRMIQFRYTVHIHLFELTNITENRRELLLQLFYLITIQF